MSDVDDHPMLYEPDTELLFKGPYTKPSMSQLRLTNKTDRLLAFKVKTTAPRMYSVMPTHGFLAANSSVTIFITLNVKESEQATFTTTVRHKFLIQSAYGPEVDEGKEQPKPERYWKDLTNAKIYEHKLQCTFEKEFILSAKTASVEKKPSHLSSQENQKIHSAPENTGGSETAPMPQPGTMAQHLSPYLPYIFAGATAFFAIYYFTSGSDDQEKHQG